jgi:hypothetical protein
VTPYPQAEQRRGPERKTRQPSRHSEQEAVVKKALIIGGLVAGAVLLAKRFAPRM